MRYTDLEPTDNADICMIVNADGDLIVNADLELHVYLHARATARALERAVVNARACEHARAGGRPALVIKSKNAHNLLIWCPNCMFLVPLESPERELYDATNKTMCN
jgi:hypothetical protein